MDEQIREAFDQISASQALRQSTRARIAQERARRSARAAVHRPAMRRVVAIAASFLLVLMGMGGYWAYLTPVSAICVETDAALELSLNRFDQVIGVTGYDTAGQELADGLDLRSMHYTDAVCRVVEDLQAQQVQITVAANDSTKAEAVLQGVKDCTARYGQGISCQAKDPQLLEDALEAQMPPGRYEAFLQLQELDPTVTLEEARTMTMRQLRDAIAAITGDELAAPSGGMGSGQGYHGGQDGQGSGQGNGQGAGQGMGAGAAQGYHGGQQGT